MRIVSLHSLALIASIAVLACGKIGPEIFDEGSDFMKGFEIGIMLRRNGDQ